MVRYDGSNFRTKLECFCVGNTGDGDAQEIVAKQEWEKKCWKWDLKSEDFGKEVNIQGIKYIICGCKPKSSKYPILGKTKNGKVYKLPAAMIRLQVSNYVNSELNGLKSISSKL